MKGSGARSNRVSTYAADDWVNGGWTVDCICGVTFDDGEEMVDCDLCGVWVHTRCSRYVKGDKSFACDNCKAHTSTSTRTRTTRATRTTALTDPEETEVAQLLVDLPTKTIHHHTPTPHRIRPYRLWAERPLHDRVHIQGVPGGDPHLFQSTAFPLLVNSQLWKSSGYIPKHFNFPCSQPDYHNPPDASQPPILDPPPTALKPPPPPPPDECAHHKPTPLLHLTSKRFREDSKDRSAKKKIKAFHTDQPNHETKRDKSHALNTVTNASTATTLSPVIESKTHKIVSNAQLSTASNIEKSKRNAATEDCKLAPRSPEDFAPTTSVDKPALDPPSQLHSSVRTTLKSLPSPDGDVTVPTIAKKEGFVVAIDEIQAVRAQSPTVAIDKPKSKPLIGELTNDAAKCKNTATFRNLEAIAPLGTGPCSSETRSDAHLDNPKGVLTSNLAGININTDSIKNSSQHVLSPAQECKGSNLCEGVTSISKPLDEKDNCNSLDAAGGCQFDRNDEITDVQCSEKLDCEGSKGTLEVQKFPCDSKEVPQLSGVVPPASPPPPSSHHKNSSVGKAFSTSAIVFSRSYIADRSRSGVSQNASLVGKQQLSNSCVNTKKEHAPVDLAKDEDKHDKPTSTLKDDPEPCSNSTLKSSQPSRTVLKYYASVGKDSLRHSSSKVSSVDSSSVSSSVNEPAVDLQSEHVLHEHNKNSTSGGQQRCEKVPQSNLQPSSKLSQSSTGHPTASSKSPAGLSDEELALLLHQELNSSPRVPRVPRVRHAGSLPHLSSTTAANMLMKRTSTSGGKDKNMSSRRKSRDALKDGIHSSREQDSEVGKVDRVPSPDSLKKSGVFNPAEVDADSKAKQNLEKISSSAASNSPISVNAAKLKSSSTRVNSPEDKAEANKNSDRTYRTLPGLIAEIMGKGRRMTYEELCNAVLPHWPNLRKHNGERYAYSSHSQAVLDCLRNRTEWARLVDRGPKTSSSRKKRKIDAEPLSSESEDWEDRNVKVGGESKNSESNKEDFPKGRRKARKGKRVASQGKSVKDGQKRRKVEVGSSCDSESFSNSSEDSLSSQDDSQGSEMDVANTEVSASSQSIRATS